MPLPFAPIDAATITALNGGDEKALESIFRSHFDVLLERAGERLGDEKPAAPRLVLAVMRELWEQRAAVHSTAEVEGFVNEELRNRARAIRSRMAAVHRFEKTEGVKAHDAAAAPSADALWKDIAAALHQPPVDPAEAAARRREHAKHDAASHIASATRPRSKTGPVIMIVVAGILMTAGYLWMAKSSKASVITQMLNASDAPNVQTRPGQLGSFGLSDSSQVRLGADSRLVRVANFGKEYRSALIVGTASIAVGKGSELPLEVRLGDASITAKAGEIAVRDYAEEPVRYVQARGGELTVKLPDAERTLAAGQTLVLGRDATMRDATAAEASYAFGWLDGKLVVQDVAVRDAMKALYRWYALDIAMQDSVVLDRKVSLDVPLESSQAAIAAMESGAQLKFEWMGQRMSFKDAAPRK